jgi:hypothetical protein
MRIPDADLLGSRAPTCCDHDGIGVVAHNEQRVREYGILQPLPIGLNPFGLKPDLGGELDKPRKRDGLTSLISGSTGGLDLGGAAGVHAQAEEARYGCVAGGNGFPQRFPRKLDRLSHSQDAIHFDLRCYLID